MSFILKRIFKNIKPSLHRDYLILAGTIVICICILCFIMGIKIHRNQKRIQDEILISEIKIIENAFTDVFMSIENFSEFIGDKVTSITDENKKAEISYLFERNNVFNKSIKNAYSWMILNWADKDSIISIDSKGYLKNPKKVPDYYPLEDSKEYRWELRIGDVMEYSEEKYKVIPVAMGIDDADGNYIGSVISKIFEDQIYRNIKNNMSQSKISYIVLDENLKVLTKSKDNNLDENISFNELKDIYENLYSNMGKLDNPIKSGDINYKFYKKSVFPFIVIAGYNKNVVSKLFKNELLPYIYQVSCITIFFLFILSIFRKYSIIPIIHEVIKDKNAAQMASKAKSDFLASMSHELRTPINGIMGMLELMQNTKLGKMQEYYADNAYKSSEALLAILNDILDLSKIEANKMTVEMNPFSLKEIIDGIMQLFHISADKNKIKLNLSISSKIPDVLIGDAMRIKQVLTNLMGNAVKFTKKGSVEIRIKLDKKEDDFYHVKFEVEDSGIGIEKTTINKLFTKFTQADMSTARQFGGTGLGLAISKQLVELMGGEIGVTSVANKGSIFYFYIPLEKGEIPKKKKAKKINLENIDFSNLKVLLCEDNEINQKLAIMMLKKLNIKTDYVGDGNQCLELILGGKKKYDLIFMDCMMPQLDGYQATQKIREYEKSGEISHKHIIIAMTANAIKGEREKCLKCGMDDFISKPISINVIKNAIIEQCF